jgi:hypothetical protein
MTLKSVLRLDLRTAHSASVKTCIAEEVSPLACKACAIWLSIVARFSAVGIPLDASDQKLAGTFAVPRKLAVSDAASMSVGRTSDGSLTGASTFNAAAMSPAFASSSAILLRRASFKYCRGQSEGPRLFPILGQHWCEFLQDVVFNPEIGLAQICQDRRRTLEYRAVD